MAINSAKMPQSSEAAASAAIELVTSMPCTLEHNASVRARLRLSGEANVALLGACG